MQSLPVVQRCGNSLDQGSQGKGGNLVGKGSRLRLANRYLKRVVGTEQSVCKEWKKRLIGEKAMS